MHEYGGIYSHIDLKSYHLSFIRTNKSKQKNQEKEKLKRQPAQNTKKRQDIDTNG